MNNWFKRNSVHLTIIVILIALSFAYFFTPLVQGKVLQQGDVIQAHGMQSEIMDVKAKTGHGPLWTNSMFGGMPAYQIWVQYPNNITSYVIETLKTLFPNPVDTVVLYLLGVYLLLCVLRVNPWLAAAGAIAFAFSTYNFILLEAGHANQAYAIAWFAPVVAGVILTFRGKYLIGAALTGLFLAVEIRTNHLQMSYYLLLCILLLVIVELYNAVKAKQTQGFFKAIAYLGAAIFLGVMVNATMLWTTYEYGEETIRGKSNLTQHTSEPGTGLDKDYAYQYSEGISEIFTFLIPNAYGGGNSTPVSDDSKVVKILTDKGIDASQATSFAQQDLPLYWGDKPIAGGPWYFGAIVCFLFVLGLLIVRSTLKWWLLSAVILSILLSYGRNLPVISNLFFDHFPLYNKFRTVESILVIAGLCFPLLAFMAVQEVINSTDKKDMFNKIKLAFYITGGLTLLMIVVPDFLLSFKTKDHQALIDQLSQAFKGDSGMANSVAGALVQDRISLERADAIRSLIFIAIAFGILWALIKQKISVTVASIGFIVITLVDMWGIDRRYLNDENFVAKDDIEQLVKPSEVDQIISRDTDPDYRVLDLSHGSPFSNAYTSFFHKSVGGYHAAKLKRFQEVIDNQFTKSLNQDVLDMLNTKYIITSDPKTQAVSMHSDSTACGHAWFVKSVKYAKNADEEMIGISSFDPKNEAIIDVRYKSMIDNQVTYAPSSNITLTSYQPDTLVYHSGSPVTSVAVFSEIYYKEGWTMLIDGKESPYFRADYILRAAEIPVGNHTIEFIFHPASYYNGEKISLAGSLLLVLALGGAVYLETRKQKAA